VIAGTVFIFQFVMTLVGFGLEGADGHVDMPQDMHIDVGDAHGDLHAGDAPTESSHGHHGSTWLFGVISVRTVVAALTVFGLAGMAGLSSFGDGMMGHVYATAIALLAGAGAMFGVHFLMRSLHQLGADGKLQLSNAVGQAGTVYLPIPASNAGSGKIHVRVQGRLTELAARTNCEERLPAGTAVRVTGVVEGSTVRVEPVAQALEK
jgi:membrane protein implicated in regulation of membrane protease activity